MHEKSLLRTANYNKETKTYILHAVLCHVVMEKREKIRYDAFLLTTLNANSSHAE